MSKRHSGVLLHISSLPSKYGIGDFGPSAYQFVDFLKSSGQKYWQILPLNPTDGINGHSPYSCFSAFAGNSLLISPQMIVMDGFLKASDVGHLPAFKNSFVDYAKVSIFKEKFLDTAFKNFQKKKDQKEFHQFLKAEDHWLENFALFVIIKSVYAGRCWNEWPKPLKDRQPKALKVFVQEHSQAIQRIKFIQYLFYKQWFQLKGYANQKGIAIIGDIPIYVNYDSVEVWRYPEFFKLDPTGNLKFISGCPPDYFSRTGQRWGNPVYDWGYLKKKKYSWWVSRIEHNLKCFDCLRIDHFRGFASFWQIPAHEKLAVFGRWVKGPGTHFFSVLSKKFKKLPIIAEDLGEITPDVIALMKKFSFAGMRVLLFAFGGHVKTNPHVPANYIPDCVAYTGTHDNNTIQGWYHKEAKPHERANLVDVLKTKIKPAILHWTMIETLMQSQANTVIVPMPDYLGLREEARMNTPATKVNNWQWRMSSEVLTNSLSKKILRLTQMTNRG